MDRETILAPCAREDQEADAEDGWNGPVLGFPSVMRLEIQTWGGMGDILREISLLPVVALDRRCGWKTGIRHRPPTPEGFHPAASCPDAEFVRDLVCRLPSCVWLGEGPSARSSKIIIRLLRQILEWFPQGDRLFAPGLQWQPEDALPGFSSPKNIVFQTHLEGLPSKRWPTDHWEYLLRGTQRLAPNAALHVLDPAGSALSGETATIHDRLTFPQALRLVSGASLLVSVDSWSKYAAAWHDIPQLILVPDQTSDYPQLTAPSVWKYSFRGLRGRPGIRLYGLTQHPSGCVQYTHGTLETFDPEAVLREVRSALEAAGLLIIPPAAR